MCFCDASSRILEYHELEEPIRIMWDNSSTSKVAIPALFVSRIISLLVLVCFIAGTKLARKKQYLVPYALFRK